MGVPVVRFPLLIFDTSELSLTVIATLLAAVGAFAYYLLYLGPLGSIPGPLLARISSLWLIYHSRKGDMHRATIALHEKYGPIVRTGPNELSVSDPAAIKKIYGAGSRFRKSDWYSVWQGRRKFDLFPERDEKVHSAQRRLVSRVYSMEALKEGEQYVDKAISSYLGKLDGLAGTPIDMALWNQLFAFDVIGEVTFSKPFGYLDLGRDDGAFAAIDRILSSASWLGYAPWIYWFDEFLTPYIGSHVGTASRNGMLRQFSSNEVEARMARGSDHRDILEKLMAVHHAKPEFDTTAVHSMAASNVNAGSDTTAISTSAVMYYLCKFPRAKAKLLEEIKERAKDGRVGASISTDVALKMPYLQACIQEGLRLHPAVGMTLPRVTPPEGVELSGRFIPGGTVVGTNAWVVHRNKDVFGDDAEDFRPERWLEGDKAEMERNFLSFGLGSRTCLGRNLSWMEMSKLLPVMLLRFEMELADPTAEWKEDCHWFVKQHGFNMVLTPRAQ